MNPIWLWGLLALLIPLIIHLWSRQKTRILPFGSLRFLQESSSSQSRSIQLTDVGLMLVRMFLLLLLVLLIAQLNWGDQIKNEKWLVLGDSISMPNALKDSDYKIINESDLKRESDYINQWYFLQELSQNYPEIDSLVWIDKFSNADFWGAIPPLSFGFQLIDRTDNGLSVNEHINIQDTIFYAFHELEDKHQMVIRNILETNAVYVATDLFFEEAEDEENAEILISSQFLEHQTLQFVIEASQEKEWSVLENWPYKTIYLSNLYLTDKRLYDELLLIISEQIAQFLVPEWNYNDWKQVSHIRRGKLDKALVTNIINDHNQEIFLIILLLLLLERYLVYRKRNG